MESAAAYDANGVALGAPEKTVLTRFPSARCQPLQWKSRAADRRCDDAKISFGGVNARITFYLKHDKVEAFDVSFDTKDAERVAKFLKSQYGAPSAETRDKIENPGSASHEIYKLRWDKGAEHAVMTALMEKRRATLSVSRGNFEEEIYRIQ
ncbi:MAG: hypothetical protein EPO20_30000 [Betaproteobacteria bacterium]|nr:MAG: hypothetical protein EPO20_30000 [Betaproteobacteria bacterium]